MVKLAELNGDSLPFTERTRVRDSFALRTVFAQFLHFLRSVEIFR
jgi:hypothetical protein